jgi:catechol 2,3-dioxygenase-like lactoylglutathione lyase family enzyme
VQRVVPVLRIRALERSRRFYVDALGFEIDWEWRPEPHDPAFLQLSKAGLSLYLSERAGDGPTGSAVYLYVSDVDAWHREAQDAGLAVETPPSDRPWGNREMSLLDPDGNRLVVASVLGR